MGKRKNHWTEEKIAGYYKEGRGSGELSSYKPWLTIQDVPSQGRVHRIKGWKTDRTHHLLSDLERNYFYLMEWADDVVDIREQFPIDRERTLKIAQEMNIKHPMDSNTNTPIVMTSDFFVLQKVDHELVYSIRSIKPSEHLNDKRTIEKLEIERKYWQAQQVEWRIVTEKDMPIEIIENIQWLHSSYHTPEEMDQQYLLDLYDFLKSSNQSIKIALNQFNDLYRLEKGTALSLFKHLLARKMINLDITRKLLLTESVQQLTFNDFGFEERLAT